jgi:hypothetical protein
VELGNRVNGQSGNQGIGGTGKCEKQGVTQTESGVNRKCKKRGVKQRGSGTNREFEDV